MNDPVPAAAAGVGHRWSLPLVAVIAFAAMGAQDLLGTAMVVFEAHFDPLAAGLIDVAGYIASLVCSVLALDSILRNGWRTRRSLVIIGAVSVANFFGTYAGVALSAAFVGHH